MWGSKKVLRWGEGESGRRRSLWRGRATARGSKHPALFRFDDALSPAARHQGERKGGASAWPVVVELSRCAAIVLKRGCRLAVVCAAVSVVGGYLLGMKRQLHVRPSNSVSGDACAGAFHRGGLAPKVLGLFASPVIVVLIVVRIMLSRY